MELLALSLFCAGLLACIAFDISILYALGAGLALFLLYGKRKGFSWKELAGRYYEVLYGRKTARKAREEITERGDNKNG